MTYCEWSKENQSTIIFYLDTQSRNFFVSHCYHIHIHPKLIHKTDSQILGWPYVTYIPGHPISLQFCVSLLSPTHLSQAAPQGRQLKSKYDHTLLGHLISLHFCVSLLPHTHSCQASPQDRQFKFKYDILAWTISHFNFVSHYYNTPIRSVSKYDILYLDTQSRYIFVSHCYHPRIHSKLLHKTDNSWHEFVDHHNKKLSRCSTKSKRSILKWWILYKCK